MCATHVCHTCRCVLYTYAVHTGIGCVFFIDMCPTGMFHIHECVPHTDVFSIHGIS